MENWAAPSIFAESISFQPNGRISTAVKNGQDNDAAWFGTKINTVREAIGDDPSNVLTNNDKLKVVCRCLGYAAIDPAHELREKP
ncbi:MAG: hypothetical protein Q8O64_08880 [Sideroxyarcus sp.]|nr:hypothetical protein [Sideroxyarcus sp.]